MASGGFAAVGGQVMAQEAAKRSALREFSEETTLHGFVHLVSDKAWGRKLVWVILMLMGAALASYLIYSKFLLFKANPVITNIDMEYPPSLRFPAITICNNNQYRISYVTAQEPNLFPYISAVYTGQKTADQLSRMSLGSFNLSEPGETGKTYMEAAAHQLDDALIFCTLPDGSECTADDFDPIVTDFGICFAFNTRRLRLISTSSAGVKRGLRVLLNVESYEYMAGPTSNVQGMKVLIYNQTTLPLVGMRGLNLPPGFETQIGVNYQQRNKIHVEDYGSCLTGQDVALVHFRPDEYTIDSCQADAALVNTEKACGCAPYNAPDFRTEGHSALAHCSVSQHFQCVIANEDFPDTSCVENCTTVQFKPLLSVTKLRNAVKAIPKGVDAKIRQKYRTATEARVRNDSLEAAEWKTATARLTGNNSRLLQFRLAPLNRGSAPGSYPGYQESPQALFGSPKSACLGRHMLGKKVYGSEGFFEALTARRADEGLSQKLDPLVYARVAGHIDLALFATNETDDIEKLFKTSNYSAVEEAGRTAQKALQGYLEELSPEEMDKEMEAPDADFERLQQAMDAFVSHNLTMEQFADFWLSNRIDEVLDNFGALQTARRKNLFHLISIRPELKMEPDPETGLSVAKPNDLKTLLDQVLNDDVAMELLLEHAYSAVKDAKDPEKVRDAACVAEYKAKVLAYAIYECENDDKGGPPKRHKRQAPGGPGGGGQAKVCDMTNKDVAEDYQKALSGKDSLLEYACPLANLADQVAAMRDWLNGTIHCASGAMKEVSSLLYNQSMGAEEEWKTAFTDMGRLLRQHKELFLFDEDFYGDNLLAFNIYYQDLSQEILTQEHSYDIWSLLGDVGGATGLFLGASALTFFEILDFFLLRNIFRRRAPSPKPAAPMPVYEPTKAKHFPAVTPSPTPRYVGPTPGDYLE